MSDQPAACSIRLPATIRAEAFHDLKKLKRFVPELECGTAKKARAEGGVAFNPLAAAFKTFKTQQAAFRYLDEQACSGILRTFAVETAATGQRTFIVTTAELFWKHYRDLDQADRHHYEIIREGSPCHLYFDLEFYPEHNPFTSGPQLVSALLSGVQELLWELFGVPWDPGYVLELDSSTPSKFSRHLIVRLPGRAFADACHAGHFARDVLLRLLLKGVHCSTYAHLLVRNKDGGLTCFVDLGVYTRNRAFRLYLSSKFGKTAVLRLTHRFRGASICPKTAFFECLVSVLKPHTTSAAAAAGPVLQNSRSSCRAPLPKRALLLLRVPCEDPQELLQLPAQWQQVPMLQLRPLEHGTGGQQLLGAGLPAQHWHSSSSSCSDCSRLSSSCQSCQIGWQQRATCSAACAGVVKAGVQPSYGPSPMPLLEQFICSVCCVGSVQGGIRSWLLQPGSSCVLFNIKNNRWCGNIGRPHKSNGIFYCVDLAAGVYYQKCYDPECRHYRSEYMPLPTHVWHAYRHLAAVPEQHQHQQQQQQVHTQAASFKASAAVQEEIQDEECLQLLLQVEQLGQLQQQQQQSATPQLCKQARPQDTGAALQVPTQPATHQGIQQQALHPAAQQQQQQQEQPPAGRIAVDTARLSAKAEQLLEAKLQEGPDAFCEDELCLQLLQQVEQNYTPYRQAAA